MTTRTTHAPVHPQFTARWSPRAFTQDTITREKLNTFFEAARWAPSAYNAQPWSFVYALRDDSQWSKIVAGLVPFNQAWATKAAALVVILSRKTMLPRGADKEVPSPTHALDTGCAWGYFALQAHLEGWVTHGMSGIDAEVLCKNLNVPAEYEVLAAVAVGKQGDVKSLPEAMQDMEKLSDRKPTSTFVHHGVFTK